jgi:hypothetical protein
MSNLREPALAGLFHPDEPPRRRLLDVAAQSIRHGLNHARPLPVDPSGEPDTLQA